MLIDRYAPDEVFARVPERAGKTDPVLHQLDRLLADDVLSGRVRAGLARRYPRTSCRGRHSTLVGVLLRPLVVKRLSNWSYREAARRAADRPVLRWFWRVYFRRVSDATPPRRRAQAVQPTTPQARNDRVLGRARRARVTAGRKLRSDGTVVQTTSHHPTASSLRGDGVRVLGRLVRRSQPLVREGLARFGPLVRQVIGQARRRVLAGGPSRPRRRRRACSSRTPASSRGTRAGRRSSAGGWSSAPRRRAASSRASRCRPTRRPSKGNWPRR